MVIAGADEGAVARGPAAQNQQPPLVSENVLANIDASSAEVTHVLCRVKQPAAGAADGGAGEVSVILDARTNERTLMFGTGLVDTGGETSVACEGQLSAADLQSCLATEGQELEDVGQCAACPCTYNRFVGFPDRFAYMTQMTQEVERRCSTRGAAAGDATGASGPFRVLMLGMGGGAMS